MSASDRNAASGTDVCEFIDKHRDCLGTAVATVQMPPAAPKRYRRCCHEHGVLLAAVGDPVVWDEGEEPRSTCRNGGGTHDLLR